MKQIFVFLLLLQFTACRHQIEVKSLPSSAMISHKGTELGATPVEITFWWYPFRPFPLEVELSGYRTMEFNAGQALSTRLVMRDVLHLQWRKLIGIETRNVHTIQLIREHGPAGTWTSKDASP